MHTLTPPKVLLPMERVGTLINKLKEQFDQQADSDQLAITAQLILAALQFQNQEQSTKGNISVVLPTFRSVIPTETSSSVDNAKQETIPNDWILKDTLEIPTLSFQANTTVPLREALTLELFEEPTLVNEFYQNNGSAVLNDQLKEERVEVASKLEETPIRDLRKAISVNDKYLFAHVLFRGDESMYERSIKTINNFSIYPEAQYWIQRELKVKLGWEEANETVRLFDQLVKRRFS